MALNASAAYTVVIDVKLGPGVAQANQGLKQTAKTTRQAGNAAQTARKQFANLAGAFVGLYAARGVGQALTGIIKPAVEFESAMARIGMLTRASGEDLLKYRKAVDAVAAKTPFAPTEIAEGLTKLRLATGDTTTALNTLEATAKVAIVGRASGMNLPKTVLMMSQMMKGYGIGADEATGAVQRLAAASLATGTTMDKYARAMGRMAAAGTVGNQSYDTLIKLFGLIGREVDRPERAATALVSMMGSFADPKKQAALEEIGIRVLDFTGNLRSADQIMLDLAKKFQTDRTATSGSIISIFGKVGARSVLPAINQLVRGFTATLEDGTTKTFKMGDAINYLNQQMGKSGYILEDATKRWRATAGAELELMKEKFIILARNIGESLLPMVSRLATGFGAMAKAAADFASSGFGKAILGIIIPVVGSLGAIFAVRAAWFGLSAIFKIAAGNIAGKLLPGVKAMGPALQSMGASARVAAVGVKMLSGALGVGLLWALPWLIEKFGQFADNVARVSMSVAMGQRQGNWFEQATLDWVRKWVPGFDKLAKTLAILPQRVKQAAKAAEDAAKALFNHIHLGTKEMDSVLKEVKGLSDYKFPEIKTKYFTALERQLGTASGKLSGDDRNRAEYARVAAGTVRELLPKMTEGSINADEYVQLNRAMQRMGVIGRFLSQRYGASVISPKLLERFGKHVATPTSEMGSKEGLVASRIIAESGGMRYATSGKQIPGTFAHGGGYTEEPSWQLPFHRKMYPDPGKQSVTGGEFVDYMRKMPVVAAPKKKNLSVAEKYAQLQAKASQENTKALKQLTSALKTATDRAKRDAPKAPLRPEYWSDAFGAGG